MAELSSSPRKSSLYRVSSLKDFLPGVESSPISTRGQHLPGLIQSHSSTRQGRRSLSIARSDRRLSLDEDASDDDVETGHGFTMREERRMSMGAQALNTPQMRSQRLIGNSNPRYRWERYFKSDEELSKMKKPIRQYYERNNHLVQNYIFIDRLLDSSLPHNLIQEYQSTPQVNIPSTIHEETVSSASSPAMHSPAAFDTSGDPPLSATTQSSNGSQPRVKRTPKNLYKIPDEQTPLLNGDADEPMSPGLPVVPDWEPEEETDSNSPIVRLAIWINLAANTALLIMKIIVTVLTSSLSVIASLVDAALDFLSTAIVFATTRIIDKSNSDPYGYPVGRRRLEPVGVLVFSVIMITSFFQVALEALARLTGDDHTVVQLSPAAIAIMASTVGIKAICWFWCRLIKNSSVQALAQDAMTDVVFNIFSIIFPLVGYYAHVWWLDPLGGLLLSCYVIINWSSTSLIHIRNLTGAAASADDRNILLYLTMRFAKTIKQIQGLQAYHAGDKINVEVDIVLDENTNLKDSHDVGESLQYVLESVPYVDRAFVHMDYQPYNLPTHMQQQE